MSESNGRLSVDLEDLEPIEIPFPKDAPKYVLREPSADAVKKFRAAFIRGHRAMPDGRLVPTEELADLPIVLLSECVYEAGDGGRVPLKDGRPDPARRLKRDAILALGGRVVESLFRRAKEIGAVFDDDDEATPGLLKKKIARLQKKLEGMEAEAREGNA